MCGIAGILAPVGDLTPAELADVASRMADAQAHRGPDGRGVWADPAGMLALGHRRLAILDLSPAGDQPMLSACGRFALCYNGEIYNHEDLRAQINAARAYSGRPALAWRGHSDTEVLLEACVLWGPQGAVERCAGMFALALWDLRERTLTLVRDRLGEKPLYYCLARGRLLFASELTGLKAAPHVPTSVDRSALALYLRLSCVPAPHSILEGVKKLPAGHLLTIRAEDLTGGLAAGREPAPVAWWCLKQTADAGLSRPFSGSRDEALDALLGLLRQSVRGQMVADVPLGALLSGGIDSSLIAALMAEMHPGGPGGVRTFTIGYAEAAYDESAQAEAVAKHLGTRHTSLTATAADALALVPKLAQISGEPFADASLIPTRLVAELTRREVTVCLSGDGGDELFAGYNRHVHAPQMWARLSGVPADLRTLAAQLMQALPPSAWDGIFAALNPLLPRSAKQRLPGEKLHKLAQALPARVAPAFYAALVSAWPDPGLIVSGTAESSWALRQPGLWPEPLLCPEGSLPWLQFLDAAWYLPEDILTKVDRAAMSVSLESRAPYLDHRVAAFAWSLPAHLRVQGGQGKIALRGLLSRYVPQELWDRPKMGFGVPLDAWLRGPLKDWAAGLLDPARLTREGYFKPGPIAQVWAEHLSGRYNRQYRLWPVLMFQAWLENFGISG